MRFVPEIEEGLLYVRIDGMSVEEFKRTPMWKMAMPAVRARACGFDESGLLFPESMSAADIDAVIEALFKCQKWDFDVELTEAFESSREEYTIELGKKAAVGLAIKAKSPSVQSEFEEYQGVVNEELARPLRDKQMWDSFFMCSMGKSANFSVPGSGKTASTLGTFAFLRNKGLVDTLLVVCPKNAFGSWRDEWKNCFGLGDVCRPLCFHDSVWAGKGAPERRKELRYNSSRYNLILLNYESLGRFIKEVSEIAEGKTLLVFDEVHKVKKVGGVRAGAALEISKKAKYVIALTGTPIPNSYLDIYNLLHILYPDDYDTYFGFPTSFLSEPLQSDIDTINRLVQPFFCRTNKDSLNVPKANEDKIYRIPASFEENVLLNEVKEKCRKEPFALIIRCLQLESDPEMLCTVLDESECEGILDSEDNTAQRESILTYEQLEELSVSKTEKLKSCIELADSLLREGKPLIIWCFFRRSMNNISSELNKKGYRIAVVCGATPQEERDILLDGFKNGKIDVLITNPHTLAESISLHSVCHDAIYFEYSYNLVHLLQSKDRIHRLGLPEGQYTQYHFLQSVFLSDGEEWSLDERIYERLSKKEKRMLDAIDRGVLEPGSMDKEDLMAVFEGLFHPPLEL